MTKNKSPCGFQEALISCLRVFADELSLRPNASSGIAFIGSWFGRLAELYSTTESSIDLEKKKEVVKLIRHCASQLAKTKHTTSVKLSKEIYHAADTIERAGSPPN